MIYDTRCFCTDCIYLSGIQFIDPFPSDYHYHTKVIAYAVYLSFALLLIAMTSMMASMNMSLS